ncbi:hypothetical protein [Fodinibius halophilus]|uniref:Uncharacterized protein n=1 Tax=Fodinibius halophilus TaxID=1736908 RepID=A0A6M1TG14_9BACT|nr:hypothetical protein [Fodinibius halophilus]NGP87580.1 hypothetical protein [Fodinibius halophilus]
MTDTTIAIPKILHEFHGKTATPWNITATYLAGTIAAATTFWVIPPELSFWPQLLLLLLALDIGGGVVANFSRGTTRYHAKRPTLRLFFIAPLHLLHPAILIYLFPNHILFVGCNTTFIILAAYLVNYLKRYETQRTTAAILLLSAIALNFLFSEALLLLSFLMILFAIKLILAYGVRWKSK